MVIKIVNSTGEVEAGGSGQGHFWLHFELEASQGYTGPYQNRVCVYVCEYDQDMSYEILKELIKKH